MYTQGFQFHKGTIRTPDRVVSSLTFLGFNSIKVRLEHKAPFNFAAVTKGFNSIKVRLERLSYVEGNNYPLGFQFHKGTIRT